MASSDTTTPGQNLGLLSSLPARWEQYSGIWEPFWYAARIFLREVWRALGRGDLGVVLRPQSVLDQAFAEWYEDLGHHFAAYEETQAVPALVSSAHGLVLELGPGTGNQLPRLDPSRVTRVVGVEPNARLAASLADRVKRDFPRLADRYDVVVGAVEDAALLERHGLVEGFVDCVLSVQVVCSLADPRATAARLHALLRPGGELIFWEHCRSPGRVTRVVQWLWSIVWPLVIGGCRLDRPIREILVEAGDWEVIDIQADEDPLLVMPRVWGRLVKRRE